MHFINPAVFTKSYKIYQNLTKHAIQFNFESKLHYHVLVHVPFAVFSQNIIILKES